MRRQKKKILRMAGVLAALCCAALLLLAPDGEPEAVAEEETQSVRLITAQEADIVKVDVETDEEKLEIVRGEDGFEISGGNAERMDQEKLGKAVERLYGTLISERLGTEPDLRQFGLEPAAARVTVTLRNEEQVRADIGDPLADGTGCYMLWNGEVCVAAGFPEALLHGKRDFYNLRLIAVTPQEGGEDELSYFRLSGRAFEKPISIVADTEVGSGYLMEEPVRSEAMFAEDMSGQTAMFRCLSDVTARSVAAEEADERTEAQYGLEDPQAEVSYCLNGESHRIRVGDLAEGGVRYMMVDDDRNIYTVEEAAVSVWADADVMDLRPSYIWLVDVGRLEKLTLVSREWRCEYRIEREGEQLHIFSGDRELDARGVWLPFYQELIGMTVMNVDMPSGWEEEPQYSIIYTYLEDSGQEPMTVSFYKTTETDRYAAFLDGNFAGVLRSNTLEEVMELADRVNADAQN